MTRRTKWFGCLAALSLVTGGLAWRQEAHSQRMHRHVSSVLKLVEQGQLNSLSGDRLGANAKINLQEFERENGKAERFEIGAVQHVFGASPTQVSGLVTRRGKKFGFGTLLWFNGRPVNYHEWPLAARKENE